MKLRMLVGSMAVSLSMLASTQAGAATATLNLDADGTSTFTDTFSAAFAEITRVWNGSQVIDGFFSIGNPAVTFGQGVDIFPNETDFSNFGTFQYDGSVANGVTAITSIADFGAGWANAVDDGSVATGIGDTTSRDFSLVSGNVTLFGGAITAVELDVDVGLSYDIPGFAQAAFSGADSITFNGDMSVLANGDFDIFISDFTLHNVPGLGDVPVSGSPVYEWDISGTASATPVPIPAAAFLLPSALVALVVVGRRRRTTDS